MVDARHIYVIRGTYTFYVTHVRHTTQVVVKGGVGVWGASECECSVACMSVVWFDRNEAGEMGSGPPLSPPDRGPTPTQSPTYGRSGCAC